MRKNNIIETQAATLIEKKSLYNHNMKDYNDRYNIQVSMTDFNCFKQVES